LILMGLSWFALVFSRTCSIMNRLTNVGLQMFLLPIHVYTPIYCIDPMSYISSKKSSSSSALPTKFQLKASTLECLDPSRSKILKLKSYNIYIQHPL
jgi:hypothetical protein